MNKEEALLNDYLKKMDTNEEIQDLVSILYPGRTFTFKYEKDETWKENNHFLSLILLNGEKKESGRISFNVAPIGNENGEYHVIEIAHDPFENFQTLKSAAKGTTKELPKFIGLLLNELKSLSILLFPSTYGEDNTVFIHASSDEDKIHTFLKKLYVKSKFFDKLPILSKLRYAEDVFLGQGKNLIGYVILLFHLQAEGSRFLSVLEEDRNIFIQNKFYDLERHSFVIEFKYLVYDCVLSVSKQTDLNMKISEHKVFPDEELLFEDVEVDKLPFQDENFLSEKRLTLLFEPTLNFFDEFIKRGSDNHYLSSGELEQIRKSMLAQFDSWQELEYTLYRMYPFEEERFERKLKHGAFLNQFSYFGRMFEVTLENKDDVWSARVEKR